GLLLLAADVANQPTAGHIIAVAAPVTCLQKTFRHVGGKALDHRPGADHETDGSLGIGLRAHDIPQLVVDDGALDRLAFTDHVLCPLRVAAHFHKGSTAFELFTHDVLLVSCLVSAQREVAIDKSFKSSPRHALYPLCRQPSRPGKGVPLH